MKLALLAGALFLLASPAPASAPEATPREETTTRFFQRDLPNAPGRELIALEVEFPPASASRPHRHSETAFVFAYVLSGEIVSAVDDQPPRTYRAGESWHELPGARHTISRNASKTRPARLLAVFVADSGTGEVTLPIGQ